MSNYSIASPEDSHKSLEDLTRLEVIVAEGQKTFVEVGQALLEIKERRLYRLTHSTWDEYTKQRWGFGRAYAHRLISAFSIHAELVEAGMLPRGNISERQLRELVPLTPEQRIEVAYGIDFSVATTADVKEAARRRQSSSVTLFSHLSVEYFTPIPILEAARSVLGEIDLDPASCADANQRVKAKRFYSEAEDGLYAEWHGRVWLNPPYGVRDGKSQQALWSARLIDEYKAGNVAEAILLVKAAVGYEWFNRLWFNYTTCLTDECLSFSRPGIGDGSGVSKQGSALVYFGLNSDDFTAVFESFGRVLPPDGRRR